MYKKVNFQFLRLYLERIFGQELSDINDPRHDVRGNRLRNLAVLEQIGHRFAGIVIALHLCDHRKMSADIVPESVVGLDIKVDHFFDVKDLVGDIVDYIAQRLMFLAVIDCGDHVVIVPAPVFFPGKGITNECTVPLQGKIGMHIVIIFGIQADALHHAVHWAHLGKLRILDGEGKFV